MLANRMRPSEIAEKANAASESMKEMNDFGFADTKGNNTKRTKFHV